jgi:hypothetical protein
VNEIFQQAACCQVCSAPCGMIIARLADVLPSFKVLMVTFICRRTSICMKRYLPWSRRLVSESVERFVGVPAMACTCVHVGTECKVGCILWQGLDCEVGCILWQGLDF